MRYIGAQFDIAMARHLWGKTYGLRPGIDRTSAADMIQKESKTPDQDSGDIVLMALYAEWYELGMPRVVVGHKHAASLMCTTMHADDIPDLVAPWHVFMIDVPSGMIRTGEGANVSRMLAFDLVEDGVRSVSAIVLPDDDDSRMASLEPAESVRELTAENMKANPCELLLARYMTGVVIEMSGSPSGTVYGQKLSRKTDPRGNPVTHTFVLRRDVKVDCRPAVASYLTGARGTSPSVQTLVRGHWKRQPIGPGRSDRKWTHIEPYWRGPEDAPIALRPHKLSGV